MQLSDNAIREYMQLYKEDFGKELTLEEGREVASRLLSLYQVLGDPLPTPQPTLPDASPEAHRQQQPPSPSDHIAL